MGKRKVVKNKFPLWYVCAYVCEFFFSIGLLREPDVQIFEPAPRTIRHRWRPYTITNPHIYISLIILHHR